MRPTIFLSRPAALSLAQEEFFDAWNAHLVGLGFKAERLRRPQYTRNPWEQLQSILVRADGVVAFGFSQASSSDSGAAAARSWSMRTSPWIHIEAAMAITTATPVLAVPEPGIEDGVFEPSVWSDCLYGIPAGIAPSRDAVPARWIDAVRLAACKCSDGLTGS